MPDNAARLLCQLHRRRYCHLVGNGTAGITLCLNALGLRQQRVAIPDSVCINVPLAVFYSGNEPVYLEIDLDDMGPSVPAVEALATSIDALLAVHGYGSVCRIMDLEALAATHGFALIEDACLAQGGRVGDRPVGSFGIASVVSFGAGKPISLGTGGAVLTDDPALYRRIKDLDAVLPAVSADMLQRIESLTDEYRRIYNAHAGCDLGEHMQDFRREALAASASFLHRCANSVPPRVAAALEALPRAVDERRANWERLATSLTSRFGNRIHVLVPAAGSVPWRLNLLMSHRDTAMKILHRSGLPASSWHPPASSLFADADARRPNAQLVGQDILNLWVTPDADDRYFCAAQEAIEQALS